MIKQLRILPMNYLLSDAEGRAIGVIQTGSQGTKSEEFILKSEKAIKDHFVSDFIELNFDQASLVRVDKFEQKPFENVELLDDDGDEYTVTIYIQQVAIY